MDTELTASELAGLGLAQRDIDNVGAMLGYREREELDPQVAAAVSAGVAATGDPSPAAIAAAARVSDRAFKLIVDYETGGKPFYEQRHQEPADLAEGILRHHHRLRLRPRLRDAGRVPQRLGGGDRESDAAAEGGHGGLRRLPQRQGFRSDNMKSLLASVKNIVFSWDASAVVFKAKTLPKFALMTDNALPNCTLLNGDCYGVLVSLTFNRGAPYSRDGRPLSRDARDQAGHDQQDFRGHSRAVEVDDPHLGRHRCRDRPAPPPQR